jgi:hypothetical protein
MDDTRDYIENHSQQQAVKKASTKLAGDLPT